MQQLSNFNNLFITDEADVRMLVENAVRGDTAPLLRLVFSLNNTAAQDQQTAALPSSGSSSSLADAASGLSKATVDMADGHQVLHQVSKALKAVAAEQEQVVRDICATNALEMAGMVTDMHHMQEGVTTIQALVTDANKLLQGSGTPVVQAAQTLRELMTVHANVAGGLAVVKAARELLNKCLEVGQLLQEHQLYQALRLVQQIQHKHLGGLLKLLSAPEPGTLNGSTAQTHATGLDGGGVDSAAAAAQAPSGKQLANMVSLRAFFDALLMELTAATDALAISEFHSWLVTARTQAHVVGLGAVRHAAIQRQQQELLAQERLLMTAQLYAANKPLHNLSAALLGSTFRQALHAELAWPPRSLAVDAQPGTPNGTSPAAAGEALFSATEPGSEVIPDAHCSQVISMQGVTHNIVQLQELHAGQPHMAVTELLSKWSKLQRRRQARAKKQASAASAALGPRSDIQGFEQLLSAGHSTGSLTVLGAQLSVACDTTLPLLSAVPMTQLLRCAHIHRMMGRTGQLREYYVEQRRLQIAADLAAPWVPFLENYQTYLGQVVGFFVVEAGVQQVLPELLTANTTALLWEGTAPQVKAVLERALCVPGALMSATNKQAGARRTPAATAQRVQEGPTAVSPTVRDAAEDDAAQAPVMVTVKEFVLLACDALTAVGCTVAAVQDVLLTASTRYHELLITQVTSTLKIALAEDNFSLELQVSSPAQATLLCHTMGLPSSLNNHVNAPSSPSYLQSAGTTATPPLPATPFHAPFTSMVPQLMTLLRTFVEDSAAYLRGVVPEWELETALMAQQDRLVHKVVAETLIPHVNSLSAGGWDETALSRSMRMVTNVWALSCAVPTLQQYTQEVAAPAAERDPEVMEAVAAAKQRPQGAGPGMASSLDVSRQYDQLRARRPAGQPRKRPSFPGHSAAATSLLPSMIASLKSLQDSAERAVLRQLVDHVDELLNEGWRTTTWQPTTFLESGPSPHIPRLVAFLQDSFASAWMSLPHTSSSFLVRTVLKSVALSYMKLFTPDGCVKGFNLIIIERLACDISILQNFAARMPVMCSLTDSDAHSPTATQRLIALDVVEDEGMMAAGMQSVTSHPLSGLAQQFAEPQQLCSLLMSSQLEDVLIPELRQQQYPDLEPSVIVLALDKYRELLQVGKADTNFPTRKHVEGLAKALRSQMVVGTAAAVLRGY